MFPILIVEDELNSRYAMEIFLRDRGFNVKAVGTADEALEVARTFKPRLLICDWFLGGPIDGVQLSRKLHTRFPNLQIFFMTGYSIPELQKRLIDIPVQKIFAKPTSLFALKSAVDSLVSDCHV